MSSNFTPKGIARYPKTNAPYSFNNATKKRVVDWDEGKFELELVLPAEKAASIIAKVKAAASEKGLKASKVKNWPFRDETDNDDEPTGNVILKFTQKAKAKDGTKRSIAHFDRKGNPLPADFRLTGGSEVIVAWHPYAFEGLGGGVTMFLDGVQVVKYVEYQANNPGFTAVAGDDDDDDGEGTGFSDQSSSDEAEESTDF